MRRIASEVEGSSAVAFVDEPPRTAKTLSLGERAGGRPLHASEHSALVQSEVPSPPRSAASLRSEKAAASYLETRDQRRSVLLREETAQALDDALHVRQLRGDEAHSNVAIGRACDVDEATIRKWRTNQKPLPAWALKVMPFELHRELVANIDAARLGKIDRRELPNVRPMLSKLDAQLANEDAAIAEGARRCRSPTRGDDCPALEGRSVMKLADRKEAALAARTDQAANLVWIKAYQDGHPFAADILVRAHDPLVATIARRYCRPDSRDWEDCLQQGRRGILVGAARHDLREGSSTHLWTWARLHINRWLIECGQGVRLPVHHYDRGGGRKLRASLWHPRSTMFSDMAREMSSDLELAFEDTLVSDEPLAEDALTDAERAALCRRLAVWLLSQTTPRNAEIIFDRFRSQPRTLLEIGDRMGVSRERIRQLEEEALTRFRRLLPSSDGLSFDEWLSRSLHRMAGRDDRREAA